jgi:hypothetical protein
MCYQGQFSQRFDFTLGAAKAEANARLRPSLNIVGGTAIDCSAGGVDDIDLEEIEKLLSSLVSIWISCRGNDAPLATGREGAIHGISRANCLLRCPEKIRLACVSSSLVRAVISAPSHPWTFATFKQRHYSLSIISPWPYTTICYGHTEDNATEKDKCLGHVLRCFSGPSAQKMQYADSSTRLTDDELLVTSSY